MGSVLIGREFVEANIEMRRCLIFLSQIEGIESIEGKLGEYGESFHDIGNTSSPDLDSQED